MALATGANRNQRPNPDRSAVANRAQPKTGWTQVPNIPFAEGRKRELDPAIRWPRLTLRWWEALREMPHCRLWTESDWCFAEATALLHKGFILTNQYAAELRARERVMGCTDESRRALMIQYVDAGPDLASVAAVTPMKRRRVAAVDPESV